MTEDSANPIAKFLDDEHIEFLKDCDPFKKGEIALIFSFPERLCYVAEEITLKEDYRSFTFRFTKWQEELINFGEYEPPGSGVSFPSLVDPREEPRCPIAKFLDDGTRIEFMRPCRLFKKGEIASVSLDLARNRFEVRDDASDRVCFFRLNTLHRKIADLDHLLDFLIKDRKEKFGKFGF